MKNKNYRKAMKTKTMQEVNKLEKAFSKKFHWDEKECGENNYNEKC